MPGLATRIGLNESIFLQQLHYWLERSVNVKEGHRWVYNTAKEWQEQFPFWSVNTIRRIIKSLEVKEFVVIDNFNSLPIDKTNWYRINYEKVEALEVKSIESEKVNSSTQNEYSKQPTWVDETLKLGKPLPEITTEITTEINNNNNASTNETAFTFYEKNGFGILTPHVGEKIGAWIDDMNEELVIHALKISIENAVLRWNYTESILKDWNNKKFTSVEQVLAAEAQRQKKKQSSGNVRRNYGGKEEIVPEWFKKDETPKPVEEKPPVEKSDLEERKRKLQEELQNMSPKVVKR